MTGAIRSMGGGNTVFRDIGFPKDEAQALLLRGDLAIQICKIIGHFGITQPCWSDLIKKVASITSP